MIKEFATECLQCKNPLCVKGCPVNNPINEIIKLILADNFVEAYKLNLNNSVLPYTCGVLCPHEKQCEGHCIKSFKGESVKIGKIESSLAKEFNFKIFKLDDKLINYNIAVVGGGIAGISCALDLARHNANVTIFEKNQKLGGPVNYSIPDFRFDNSFYNNLENTFNELNVKILYNKELGINLFIDDLNDFDYVVFALGTEIDSKPLSFEDERFISGVQILKQIKSNEFNFNIKNALVIGAGNVAVDAARALKRRGIDTSIVYRRAFVHSPALKSEINDCINDEVNLLEQLDIRNISKVGSKLILTVEKTIPTENLDRSNRPIYKGINEFIDIETDLIVYATGSKPDLSYIESVFPSIINNGWINSKDNFYKHSKYYFIGDMVSGPTTIVNSMKAGLKVGKDLINNRKYFMFGGSFDPVTIAHVEVIKHIVEKFGDESLVYIVPNGDNYHFGGKKLTSFEIRKELLNTSLKRFSKNIYVSDIEQNEEFIGIYYSLKALDNPCYIIGSDLLYTLPVWKKAEELISENKFYVIERENYSLNILNENDLLKKHRDNFILSNLKLNDISSSKIRSRENLSFIPNEIKEIVKNKNLYNKEENNEK